MSGVRGLFSFSGLAIVGASPRATYAHPVLNSLKGVGFTGQVAAINPNADAVGDCPGFATLAEVPFPVDGALIVVRAERVPPVLEECGRRGIRSVTIISSGFGEAGAHGRALDAELAAIAARYDIAVCGPNCLGFISPYDRTSMYVSFGFRPLPGDVAVVSQSGGLLNEVVAYGSYRGLRFSKLVSSGNEAVLNAADYLEDFVADERTTTIALIVEGIRDEQRFRAALARAAELRKPVVAIKLGTSALAGAATLTHTGVDAGPPERFAALCDEYGVTLVEDIDDLCETLLTFSRGRMILDRPPSAGGFAAVEISGGGKELICDLAERAGLSIPTLSPRAAARMEAALGEAAPAAVPFDIVAPWETPKSLELHETALEVLTSEGRYDLIASRVTVATSGKLAGALAHGELINRFRAAHPALFFTVLGRASDTINPEWQAFCAATGLTYLQGYRRGIAALARLHAYRNYLARVRTI